MAKENKSSQKNKFRWDFYLVDLVSRVGIFGTVVIALLTLFIFRGTEAQHRAFIDKFFLLKWGSDGIFISIATFYARFKGRCNSFNISEWGIGTPPLNVTSTFCKEETAGLPIARRAEI